MIESSEYERGRERRGEAKARLKAPSRCCREAPIAVIDLLLLNPAAS